MKLDLALAAIIAAAPWISMNSLMEAKRLALLAAVYAVISIVRRLRLPALQGAVGVTMLTIGWLESFPAWNHSAEIGTYGFCGAAVLALASFRAARRSQLSEA